MESMMMTIITLLGGLGLFVYGMKLMGDGLENAAGDGLKSILEKVTGNPITAVLIGAAVTAVIQSSSATTVMVVGFVNAGLMNLTQAVGIIMGANIGTTITAQLVAFKLDDIAPLFVFIGAAIVMFAKGKKRKEIGNIILGFGILFTGMGIMSSSMKPLTNSEVFKDVLLTIGDNWPIGILAGAVITAVLQSSSATTGILVGLATAGAIDIKIALPIVFGCNIGTCVTAILSSVGANKTAHKAAAMHLIFNILGTIIFIPFLGLLGDFVYNLSPNDVQRQIANAHTVFNIVNTLIMLPFSKYLIIIVNKIIPGNDEEEEMGVKYIDDRLLETPVIAEAQVIKETVRMANKSKKALELSMKAFMEGDEAIIKKAYDNEDLINLLEQEITKFLVKLSKREIAENEKVILASTFHVITDIERIGDHAKNIVELATEKMEKNLKYTDEAIKELYEIYNYTLKALEIAISSYENKNSEEAKKINDIEASIDDAQARFRIEHIKRLYDDRCTAYTGAIFLDLISNFERIGDHSTNIAQSVIDNY